MPMEVRIRGQLTIVDIRQALSPSNSISLRPNVRRSYSCGRLHKASFARRAWTSLRIEFTKEELHDKFAFSHNALSPAHFGGTHPFCVFLGAVAPANP